MGVVGGAADGAASPPVLPDPGFFPLGLFGVAGNGLLLLKLLGDGGLPVEGLSADILAGITALIARSAGMLIGAELNFST